MAKTTTINTDELEALREAAGRAEARATDAEAGEKRAREEAITWHTKWEAAMVTAQKESAARVRAERDRFETLRGQSLRSLLWLDDNIAAAITKHAGFLHLARVVPEIVAREFGKEVTIVVEDGFGAMAAENGMLVTFHGDVVFDLVLPWEAVEEISSLEGRSVPDDDEARARYDEETLRYRELLTVMLRELIG